MKKIQSLAEELNGAGLLAEFERIGKILGHRPTASELIKFKQAEKLVTRDVEQSIQHIHTFKNPVEGDNS